jgi:subtilisin-like proprotein convertase family protein
MSETALKKAMSIGRMTRLPVLRRLILLSALCLLTSLAVTASTSAATLFTNTNQITIPDDGSASPYPSEISVSGLNGPITDVSVTLHRFGHADPDDVDILLVSPSGKGVILMSDACGITEGEDFTWTFSQSAPHPISVISGDCADFAYQPANYGSGDFWPTPAPPGPYSTSLSAFDRTNPNGEWRLFVNDDSSGNTGFFTNHFTLGVTTDTTPPTVVSVNPANDARGIKRITNVSATFSEAMRPGSINRNTFELFKAGTTTRIGATVNYDAMGGRALLNPNSNLKPKTKYKAAVTTGAKDLSGNDLDQNPVTAGNQQKVWFFTTRR